MHYLTVIEYAKFRGITTVAVYDKLKRGTLDSVEVPVMIRKIPVEDAEYERLLKEREQE